MQSELLAGIRGLSDDLLVARVRQLVGAERASTAEVVAHLAELDTREVHYRAGHGSLFAYCRDALGLSEQDAFNRISVARAARRFPVLLQMLEDGALNLSNARLLAPHLTPDNHKSVLEAARGKSKAEVEELAAALWPRPDAPSLVRKLPTPSSAVTPWSAATSDRAQPSLAQKPTSDHSGERADVTPLSPDRYKVQVTIGGETLEKLRLAKDLLRHAVPSGDEAVIFDRALTALLSDLAQKKFAAVERPRPSAAPRPGSRTIPAETKRRVWLRDLGRCAFVAPTGRRCTERAFLEFHHLEPYALGGEATLANIQLRCRSHNAYEARLWFGRDSGNGGAGSVREAVAGYRVSRSRTAT